MVAILQHFSINDFHFQISLAENRYKRMYQEFKDININKTAIQGTLPEMPSRLLKQAYYAAISHIDEQFGFALDALEYVRR